VLLWVLLGVTVLALIWGCLHEDFGFGVGAALGTALVGAILLLVLFVCNVGQIKADHVGTAKKDLKALDDTSAVKGKSYYLGGSYIGSSRVLNYITEVNGEIRLEQAAASESVIREDTDKPYVKVHEWNYEMGWLVPWRISHTHTYEFHVTPDSVLESHTIDNS
jgi:hypothetical protein